jgi:GNAT superfamily N-acetyltransferase
MIGPLLRPCEPLSASHDLDRFSNGRHPSLDVWLKKKARRSEGLSSRTYVACTSADPSRVVGYFALATASEQRVGMPTARLRRDMPEKVPLLLIGRLAVDAEWQGRGLGSALLVDAVGRCVAAGNVVGARGILAHAIDDAAMRFYRKHDFVNSPLGDLVMLLPMALPAF